jgi:NADH:ubiquinone oxidoreductase subunit 5 (subunit L)/multisubunit Na+/H+ antiporter MnhA subunit
MSPDTLLAWLCFVIAAAPAAVFFALGLRVLVGRRPTERVVAALTLGACAVAFAGALAVLGFWLAGDRAAVGLDLGAWFATSEYDFELTWVVDRLTVVLLPLVTGVVLVIARFAVPYLHRERGFTRFFLQLMLFAAGMSVIVLAGSADVAVIGWECVGISSALLIAFFHERAAPPRSAVRVFTTYRLCDVGLLIGVVLLHVLAGTTDFAHVFGAAAWPGGTVPFGGMAATTVALCFGLAAAGKSAQLPVGNWLARAMEGPTPSSALFYGGPAVHAGVILLMRLAPLFTASPVASAFLVVVGLGTALHATLAWRVQTDQKSALAFATMTQLGLIVAECGFGLWTFALGHTVAHVCLRTFQQVRAPSALHDAHVLRATNHGHPLETPGLVPVTVPAAVGDALRRRLYALGLARSHLDELIDRWLVDPVVSLGRRLDAAERRWFDVLGQVSRSTDVAGAKVASVLEEETP